MRTVYLEPETVDLIRRNMTSDDWVILQVANETGMRIGDIVSLRSGNVSDGLIRYTAQKTGKYAEVPLSGDLRSKLSRLRSKNVKKWLFPSPYNHRKHITRQCVWQRVKRACVLAGVDPSGVAPHSFRKCFAVDLFKREGLEATREALQHDRASTTQLYALADFTSGDNALKPLLRRDLPFIISEILACLKPLPSGC